MASLKESPAVPLVPSEPTSVQPGGFGLCTRAELAWGKFRRAYLRRFRPGYVQRMRGRLQGSCPDCCHDIIDARDLKYFRNVCGYSFKPEDDAFAWRDNLGLARAGLAEVLIFSLGFACVTGLAAVAAIWFHWAFWFAVVVLAALWFEVVFFFRDPRRTIPADPAAVLSPADGTVTDVGEVDDPDFPGGRAFRISIFLSVFNVHVNRAPRTGQVVAVRYFRGCFLDARSPDCAKRNEQLWLDLKEEATGRFLRIKQVSGAIARRIVCCLRAGDHVRAGDRFGMIKFGSRTDVLLPTGESLDVRVKVGDKVHGGSTVLLRFNSASRNGPG